MGVSSPQLLEVILDGSFSDVLRCITPTALQEKSSSSPPEAKKRHADPPSVVQPKRERKSPETLQTEKRVVRVVRRAGEVLEMNVRRKGWIKIQHHEKHRKQISSGDVDVVLRLSWMSDTGRCVDASPVLLVQDPGDQSTHAQAAVFIGSHSHRMQALDLVTGSVLWERILGERIEASAAVSHCGSLIVVGEHQVSEYLTGTLQSVICILPYYGCLFVFFTQVVMTAAYTSCVLIQERHSGCLRQETQ